MSTKITYDLPSLPKSLTCLPITKLTKKTLDKYFHYEKIAKRKVCIFLGVRLQASEAARIFLDNIYSHLYFSLPRLPTKPSGITLNERLFSILMLLELKSRQGKVLTIGDIGEIGKLSASDATRKIKDLERRGLVKKSNVKSDDRLKEVTLTPQGVQVLQMEKQNRIQWFENVLSKIDEKEKTLLVEILIKIITQIQKL